MVINVFLSFSNFKKQSLEFFDHVFFFLLLEMTTISLHIYDFMKPNVFFLSGRMKYLDKIATKHIINNFHQVNKFS